MDRYPGVGAGVAEDIATFYYRIQAQRKTHTNSPMGPPTQPMQKDINSLTGRSEQLQDLHTLSGEALRPLNNYYLFTQPAYLENQCMMIPGIVYYTYLIERC